MAFRQRANQSLNVPFREHRNIASGEKFPRQVRLVCQRIVTVQHRHKRIFTQRVDL